jgi:hypothetical protein
MSWARQHCQADAGSSPFISADVSSTPRRTDAWPADLTASGMARSSAISEDDIKGPGPARSRCRPPDEVRLGVTTDARSSPSTSADGWSRVSPASWTAMPIAPP